MCVFADQRETEEIDYGDICWQEVRNMMCINPLGPNQKTTYTECCCLHGYAWGMQCALCPSRDTGTPTHTHVAFINQMICQ